MLASVTNLKRLGILLLEGNALDTKVLEPVGKAEALLSKDNLLFSVLARLEISVP